MRHYDLSCLISPELDEQKAKNLSQEIITLIKENGALLDETKEMSKIALAYPIEKKREAYFYFITFFLEPIKIKNLRDKISKTKNILRLLVFSDKKRVEKEKPRIKPQKPVIGDKEPKVKLQELDKKLDEILNK